MQQIAFDSVQIARFILGGSWIYHGLAPKLITVAPIERAMTATLGLDPDTSLLITRLAGVGEVVFGILLIIFYRQVTLIALNIAMLVALLIFVAVQIPAVLFDAFNPVTTNLALIGLSCVLLQARN
ncbi:DoxX-like family protein [Arenicella chitinivorans]|nr:DoxX-like family protein [Arenicella chitinivorans]